MCVPSMVTRAGYLYSVSYPASMRLNTYSPVGNGNTCCSDAFGTCGMRHAETITAYFVKPLAPASFVRFGSRYKLRRRFAGDNGACVAPKWEQRREINMNTKIACLTLLIAGWLGAGTATASYLAPDPGTQISIQLNAHDVLVVRPVGGVWSHGLCPDVTAAVLTSSHWTRQSHGFGLKGYNYVTVWDLLMQA